MREYYWHYLSAELGRFVWMNSAREYILNGKLTEFDINLLYKCKEL